MNDFPAGYSIVTALERRRRCSGSGAVREHYYGMDLSAHSPPACPAVIILLKSVQREGSAPWDRCSQLCSRHEKPPFARRRLRRSFGRPRCSCAFVTRDGSPEPGSSGGLLLLSGCERSQGRSPCPTTTRSTRVSRCGSRCCSSAARE